MAIPVPPGVVEPQPNVLDEVRARLEALEERPLHEHPEQFAAIDRLLRTALDGTTGSGAGQGGASQAQASQAHADRAGLR